MVNGVAGEHGPCAHELVTEDSRPGFASVTIRYRLLEVDGVMVPTLNGSLVTHKDVKVWLMRTSRFVRA